MSHSSKGNIALIVGGSVLGILLGLTAGLYLIKPGKLFSKLPAGAVFEDVEDFRRSMLERDERDGSSESTVSLRTIIQPHPSERLLYTLRPNLDLQFMGVPLRTNSHGMRGPERSIEKPSGVVRIALLGDSFAFGWGVSEENIFATKLEQSLNDALPNGPRVEVLNFGTPGYSTFQEVEIMKQRALQFSPDAALVFFIENDFGLPFFIKSFQDADSEQLYEAHQHEHLKEQAVSEEAKQRSGQLLGFLDTNGALLRLAEIAKEHRFPVYFTINPGRRAEKLNSRLWALRQREEFHYMPLRSVFLKEIERQGLQGKSLQLPNDPHPNAVWHEMIGALLAEMILESGFPGPASPRPPA